MVWRPITVSFLLALQLSSFFRVAAAGPKASVPQETSRHEIEEILFESKHLGEARTLLVRLPRDYPLGEARYPVLYVLDAAWHFNLAVADVELLSECSYVEPHPVPPLIVVGVLHPDRNRDFTPTTLPEFRNMRFPTSGGADAFRAFLVGEVLPLIDHTYRTQPYRILAGWSLGGLFTVNTLLSDTPAFDAYLAISPSLWWDDEWTLTQLQAGRFGGVPDASKRLAVTLGTAEKGSMVEGSTRHFLDWLSQNPLERVVFEEIAVEGLGHNFSPKMAYFLGLASLFSDWNVPAPVLDQGLVAVDAYYDSLSAQYHFEVPVPQDAYSKLGWSRFETDRKDEAGEVFRSWVERHPRSSLARASLGAYYQETGHAEEALRLLREALVLEKKSPEPRQAFIQDLQRDVETLLHER